MKGANRLSEEAVLEQAQIYPGINTLQVNLSKARKRLLNHPWIAAAEVKRHLPSALSVVIQEHQPFAILDLGRKFILNSQGRLFKEWRAGDPSDLPVVTGLGFSDIPIRDELHEPENDSRYREFQAVMDVLRLGQHPESVIPSALIQKISVDKEMGLTLELIQDTKENLQPHEVTRSDRSAIGVRIIKLGYHHYPQKYQQLEKILGYLREHPSEIPWIRGEKRMLNVIDSIDLNRLNRIVVNCEPLSVIGNAYDAAMTTDN